MNKPWLFWFLVLALVSLAIHTFAQFRFAEPRFVFGDDVGAAAVSGRRL